MDQLRNRSIYEVKSRGTFGYHEIEATPFNHWKKDCEWLIALRDQECGGEYFFYVKALSAREACTRAINELIDFQFNEEEPDEF